MDKFLNYMKLNGEEDDEYYDDDYLDEEDDEPAPPPRRNSSKIRDMEDYEDERMSASRRQQTSSGKITPIKQATSRRVAGSGSMEVCVIKPTSVEDAREITETLLANHRFHQRILLRYIRKFAEDFPLYFYHYAGKRGHIRRFSGHL